MKKILLTSLLLLLTACSPSSPKDKLVEVLKTTRSWAATAKMVAEAWQQGSIPDRYAGQTLAKSQQEIAKETNTLNNRPVLLLQLQQTIQLMGANVEGNKRMAIATSLQKLSAEQQQLDELAKSSGAQP
jgi:patatin-like phospholipase/acyl hydrolase